MTVKIKSINVRAFRGIPKLELDLDGKSLILRGENGAGKSSLVDAIEFFFTGRVSHLEGTQGISLLKHGPHINYGRDDVMVSLSFNTGSTLLSRNFATQPVGIDALKDI